MLTPARRSRSWHSRHLGSVHGHRLKGEQLQMGFLYGLCKTTTTGSRPAHERHGRADCALWSINSDWFEAYVTQVSVPKLRPGNIVIMDNLPCRKRMAVRN